MVGFSNGIKCPLLNFPYPTHFANTFETLCSYISFSDFCNSLTLWLKLVEASMFKMTRSFYSWDKTETCSAPFLCFCDLYCYCWGGYVTFSFNGKFVTKI